MGARPQVVAHAALLAAEGRFEGGQLLLRGEGEAPVKGRTCGAQAQELVFRPGPKVPDGAGAIQRFRYVTLPNIKGSLALCALLRTIDTFRLFEKVNVLTGGGPAGTTSTITQYLYNYGIKSLDFGFGSAGAIVMTLLVLILSSVYIKRAMS